MTWAHHAIIVRAKRQAVINPENTFFSVKRFIGSKESEISEEAKTLPYRKGKTNLRT